MVFHNFSNSPLDQFCTERAHGLFTSFTCQVLFYLLLPVNENTLKRDMYMMFLYNFLAHTALLLHFISVTSWALPPAAIRTVSLRIQNSKRRPEKLISPHSSLSSLPLQKTARTETARTRCIATDPKSTAPHTHGWCLRKKKNIFIR